MAKAEDNYILGSVKVVFDYCRKELVAGFEFCIFI